MSTMIIPPAVLDDTVEAVRQYLEDRRSTGQRTPLALTGVAPTALARAIAQESRRIFRRHYSDRHPGEWDRDLDVYEWRQPDSDRPQLFGSLVSAIYQLADDGPPTALYCALKEVSETLAQTWMNASTVLDAHEAAQAAGAEWMRRDGRTHPANSAWPAPSEERQSAMTMDNRITIPLNRLRHSPLNVRAYEEDATIPQLAASLVANQLHPLFTLPSEEEGHYEVFAGGRRLEAFRLAAQDERIAQDHPVDVVVFDDPKQAQVISLEENYQRLQMTPLVEAAAFSTLVGQGTTLDEIGARFGVERRYIGQRLRLAGLAQTVRDALRAGRIDLAAAEAYASTEDTERQTSVFEELDRRGRIAHNPDEIRRRLLARGTPAGDKLAVFVGLDVYAAAGGTIEEDLFTTDSERVLNDPALLQRLATQKLADEFALLKELHGFTEVSEYSGYQPKFADIAHLEEVVANRRPPNPAEERELNRLLDIKEQAETAATRALDDAPADATPESDALLERLRLASEAAAEAVRVFESELVEEMDSQGLVAFVKLQNDGTLSRPRIYRPKPKVEPPAGDPPVERVAANSNTPSLPPAVEATPEPAAAETTSAAAEASPAAAERASISFGDEDDVATTDVADEEAGAIDYSGAVAAALAYERAAVLKDALADQPELALDLLIFSLASAFFSADANEHAAIGLAIKANPAKPNEPGEAWERFEGRVGLLDASFLSAGTQVEGFQTFRAIDETAKFQWLGFVVANALQPSLSWRDTRGSLPIAHDGGSKRVDHAAAFHDHLGELMSLRLREHWAPNCANLFDRLRGKDLITILGQIGGQGLAGGMRNASVTDLATTADALCAGRGHAGPTVVARGLAWTPPGMGFSADTLPDEAASQEAGTLETAD